MLLLASFLGMGQALQFGRLGGGLENNGYITPVRSIFYDTIDKKLYVSGQFKTAENKIVWGAAVWNGTMWDSLQGGFTQYPHQISPPGTPSQFAWKIIRYKNKIYFGGGGIEWVNGKNQYNLGVWNGTNWEYPLPQPSPANNSINDMIVYNDTLYACGNFTNFGAVTCNYVAKYDGISWHPVGDFKSFMQPFDYPAQMNAIEVYNNEIYVGGAFDDATGMVRNIAKFDGTNWVNVGTGIRQGGINSIFALEVFNNKLYMGGRFGRTQEIPGNNLVAWNGNNYEEVAVYDMNGGQINFLKQHKNKLLVTGAFINYGTINAFNHFFLDENNLSCATSGLEATFSNTTNLGFYCFDFIGDSLVVAGLFKYLDTVAANNIGVITNYENNLACLYVGIKENTFGGGLIKVYPNPVKEKLNIEFSIAEVRETNLSIVNSLGQVVYMSNAKNQLEEIDLSSFKSGMYFLKIQNNSEQKVLKIIKD